MRYQDSLVGVKCCLSMLVDLREQSTYLHVRLALVLQHF